MGNTFDTNSVNYHRHTNKLLHRWYVPCTYSTPSLRCHSRQGLHSRPEHGSNEKNCYPCWESKPGSHHWNCARANWHVATRWRVWFLMLRNPWPILRPLRENLTAPRLVKISPHFWNLLSSTKTRVHHSSQHMSLSWIRWIQFTHIPFIYYYNLRLGV